MVIRVAPPNHKVYFWQTEHGLDLIRGLATFAAAAAGAIKGYVSSPDERNIWVSIAIAVSIVGAIDVWKYLRRRSHAISQRNFDSLDAAVEAIRACLLSLRTSSIIGCDLRMCIFVPDPADSETVHQLTDYIGDTKRHGRNRTLPARAGVVGLALRDGVPKFAGLPNGTQPIDFLVAMGFHRSEAANMTLSRKSWAAVPIGDGPGRTVAILYADSPCPKFWGNSDDKKRAVVVSAASAVAKHLTPV